MDRRPKTEYLIRSLDHTLDVLEALAAAPGETSLSGLTRMVTLHKNSVFRLAATLEGRGYLEKNPVTGDYRLGPAAFELGCSYLRHADLAAAARPVLEKLSDSLRENAYLAVLRDGGVFYLEEAPAEQTIRVASRLGSRVPFHCTATGKVHLAFLPPAQAASLSRGPLSAQTPRTITDPRRLEEEIALCRGRGAALDLGEWEEGVVCVAAPVFDDAGRLQGAVSVSGPEFRMGEERLRDEVVPAVKAAAAVVSRRLGHAP